MITAPQDIISVDKIADKIRRTGTRPDASPQEVAKLICDISMAFDALRSNRAAIDRAARALADHYKFVVGSDIVRRDGAKIAVDTVNTGVYCDEDGMFIEIEINAWGYVRGTRKRKTKRYEYANLCTHKF